MSNHFVILNIYKINNPMNREKGGKERKKKKNESGGKGEEKSIGIIEKVLLYEKLPVVLMLSDFGFAIRKINTAA